MNVRGQSTASGRRHQRDQAPAGRRVHTGKPRSTRPDFRKVMELPPGPRIRGIAWAPDGTSLIIGKHDATSDIGLVDLRLP